MIYPDYIAQLENGSRIIADLVDGLTQKMAAWKPEPGVDYEIASESKSGLSFEHEPELDSDRWSVLEIIGHLIDIEIEDFRYDFSITLEAPETSWPDFDIFAWISEHHYNERNLEEAVEHFLSERKQSIFWLQSLIHEGNDASGITYIYPDLQKKHSGNGFRRGAMSLGNILASWVAHDLYHIRQLTLLKWDILNKWCRPYSPIYSGFER